MTNMTRATVCAAHSLLAALALFAALALSGTLALPAQAAPSDACPGTLHAAAPTAPIEPVFGPAGNLVSIGSDGRPMSRMDPVDGDFIPGIRVDDGVNPEHREPAAVWGPGGEIYAAYAERVIHWNPELIMFARSHDDGLTWLETPVRVNDTSPNAAMFPAIDILDDGTILLAWTELKFAPYNDEMRFSRSEDGGDTWSPSRVIHPIDPSEDYYRPSVLVVGDRILVSFWEDAGYPNGRPVLVYSDDRGNTWSDLITISTMLCNYCGSAPCLAYNEASDEIGVVVPTHDERIYFLLSADDGESWSAPIQVNDAYASSADYPDLACGEEYFYVVWMDNRNGQYDCDIWISRSSNGEDFSPSVKVNDSFAGNQYEPHIRVDPLGNVHVCWIWCLPFQSSIDLYYSVSVDGGATWEWPCPRVNDIPYLVQPYVSWTSELLTDASGGVYLFWNDGRITDYYDSIYFSRRLDPSGVDEGIQNDGVARATNGDPGKFMIGVLEHPGPSPIVRLSFTEPAANVRLELIDPAGRRRGFLTPGPLGAGDHFFSLAGISQTWPLPRGAYFARVSAGQETSGRRVVIVR